MHRFTWALIGLLSATTYAAAADVPLVEAVQSGDWTRAIELIRGGADVNLAEADGTTALHWAVYHNERDVVRRLLEAGADPNTINDYGAAPLVQAVDHGDRDVFRTLLDAGADPNTTNSGGQPVLMLLAKTSYIDAVRLLLEHGADPNRSEPQQNQSALMWASAASQGLIVRALVEHGADVDFRSTVNERNRMVSSEPRAQYQAAGGLTPLLYATREGCLECVEALVEGGADVDLDDPEGVTPLIMATWNAHWDTARYLLQAGADPNKWDWWGRTPLYLAADFNTVPHGGRSDRPSLDDTTALEMLELLLDAGANPNLQLKILPPFRNVGADRGVDRMLTTGATALLRAAKALDAPAIRVLLEHGAHPNLPNNAGITPTMAAAGLGSTDADTRGWFHTSDVEQRSIAALTLLLDNGGEINQSGGERGQTPLHGAAFWGWNQVVRFLAERGADLNATDLEGMAPLDAAMGRAGGNSRGGQRIDVFEDTGALIEELGGRAGSPREEPSGEVR